MGIELRPESGDGRIASRAKTFSEASLLSPEAKEGLPPLLTPEEFDAKVRTDPSFGQHVAGFTSVNLEQFQNWITHQSINVFPYGKPDEELLFIGITKSTQENIFRESMESDTDDPVELRDLNSGYGELSTFLSALGHYSPLSYENIQEKVFTFYPWDGLRDRIRNPESDEYEYPLEKDVSIKEVLDTFEIEEKSFPALSARLRKRGGMQIVYEASDEFFEFVASHDVMHDPNADQSMAIAVPIPSRFILAVIPYGKEEQEYYQQLAA